MDWLCPLGIGNQPFVWLGKINWQLTIHCQTLFLQLEWIQYLWNYLNKDGVRLGIICCIMMMFLQAHIVNILLGFSISCADHGSRTSIEWYQFKSTSHTINYCHHNMDLMIVFFAILHSLQSPPKLTLMECGLQYLVTSPPLFHKASLVYKQVSYHIVRLSIPGVVDSSYSHSFIFHLFYITWNTTAQAVLASVQKTICIGEVRSKCSA